MGGTHPISVSRTWSQNMVPKPDLVSTNYKLATNDYEFPDTSQNSLQLFTSLSSLFWVRSWYTMRLRTSIRVFFEFKPWFWVFSTVTNPKHDWLRQTASHIYMVTGQERRYIQKYVESSRTPTPVKIRRKVSKIP